MKKIIGLAFAVGLLGAGMSSCTDCDEMNYFMSNKSNNMIMGNAPKDFTGLWACSQPEAWEEGPESGVLRVPANGGKYTLDINPEATYTTTICSPEAETFGPYDIPLTLYPVPDCVVEKGLDKPVYYTCSPAVNGRWMLSYAGPLESPYGKFYMDKNRLVIDMDKCGKEGRELLLEVVLSEDLQDSFTNSASFFGSYRIRIVQGR